ncbi:MAG: hypothetical protein JNJ77_10910 [Planctomycetia bacterium]|nr:hypothetical protein [Planctomycetia bacterium]
MLCLLTALLLQPASLATPQASVVILQGGESPAQVLQLLNQTGNRVTTRNNLPVQWPDKQFQLTAGKKTFWELLDLLTLQCQLSVQLKAEEIELSSIDSTTATYIAYSGPWRARLLRRSIVAYEDASLDRLILQVELALEPRLVPLLIALQPAGQSSPATSYSFEGEPIKVLEFRLPRPPRTQTHLEEVQLAGIAWLAPGRITMTMPCQPNTQEKKSGITAILRRVDKNSASQTWELSTEVQYPPGTREWESHQSRLFNSLKLQLRSDSNIITPVGREIRTDSGSTVNANWLLRNVPNSPSPWKVELTIPTTPQEMPVQFTFRKVALP